MKAWLVVLFLCPSLLFSQEKGDPDYIFTSLKEADERPEIVYHLSLEKKKLTEFPKTLSRYENLRILDLSKNRISLIPAEIGELLALEELNLSKNRVYNLPPQLANLQDLKVLLLSKNDIEKIPAEIGELSALEELDLWDNNIKDIDEAIAKLKELKRLDLRGMIFSDEMTTNLKEWFPDIELLLSAGCDCGF